MAYKIRWSDNAIDDYKIIVKYLAEEWSVESALRFIEIVEYKMGQISVHPQLGRASSKNKEIRSILLTKQNRMYYRLFHEGVIEIANIFDTRQDPSKNTFED